MNPHHRTCLSIAAILCVQTQVDASLLGTAESFGILAGTTVTNTGPSTVYGNVGVWSGSAITGFPPGVIMNGSFHAADAVAQQAQSDVTAAYNSLAGMTSTSNMTGVDLGGQMLGAGVYTFDSSAFLTGSLTLDGGGDPNAIFVFQISSTLITAVESSILTINGASACNIYWQVGSSATLGVSSEFQGSILALTSITMNTGATILDGRALARNGAVTMDSNTVAVCVVPAPSAAMLGLVGLGCLGVSRRRSS